MKVSELEYQGALYQQEIKELALQQKQQNEDYEVSVKRQEVEMNKLQVVIETKELKAPCDGTIVSLANLDQGATIEEESAILVIADMTEKKIGCDLITESKIAKADDYYAFFDGKRYEIEYIPKTNEEYTKANLKGISLRSSFATDDEFELAHGKIGNVIMISNHLEKVLTIPIEALLTDSAGNYVYRIQNGTRQRVDVLVDRKSVV